MLIKSADDKTPHIEALGALLDRPDVDATLRKRIEQEIKISRAGVRGEAEAAYKIDFHYKEREGWAVVHDLRIEVGGRVAQIDHLLLNRLLDCYVLETKSFSEGVSTSTESSFGSLAVGPRACPRQLNRTANTSACWRPSLRQAR